MPVHQFDCDHENAPDNGTFFIPPLSPRVEWIITQAKVLANEDEFGTAVRLDHLIQSIANECKGIIKAEN